MGENHGSGKSVWLSVCSSAFLMDMLSFFSSPPLTIPCLPANTGRSDPWNIELTGASLLFQDMQFCHSRITIRKAPSEGSGISSRSPLYFVPRLQESKLQSNQITIPTGGGVFHTPSVPISHKIRTRRLAALATLDPRRRRDWLFVAPNPQ